MSNVFYVESPGQIISAFEAMHYYKGSSKLYVRLNGSKYNDEQIKKTIIFYKENTEIKPEVIYLNGILQFIIKVVVCFRFSIRLKFVGCHKSKYVRLLSLFINMDDTYILDDGIASLIYKRKGGRAPLFTCLEIKEDNGGRVVKHKFECLKNIINHNVQDTPVFFGAKYVESGLISLDNYTLILKNLLNIKGPFIYVAHRAESDDNLKRYQLLGLSIVRFDYPSEIELSLRLTKPREVYGIYSASLITSKILFPEINVFYIRPCTLDKNNPMLDFIYDGFGEYGINELTL